MKHTKFEKGPVCYGNVANVVIRGFWDLITSYNQATCMTTPVLGPTDLHLVPPLENTSFHLDTHFTHLKDQGTFTYFKSGRIRDVILY